MEHADPIIAILGIGTAVPEFRIDQADTAHRLAEALRDSPDSARWAKRIFKQCGVETRYTCEPNLLESADSCRYFPRGTIQDAPSTRDRMQTYKRESVPLSLDAAHKALLDGNIKTSDITHLFTVSCTGQFLPGLDTVLANQLGLAADVNRTPLNFLGCAAGLKAISLSRQVLLGNPSAKVLIVCVELCTLHIQPSSQREALFAASFFGDGASACIIGAPGPDHKDVFQLDNGRSVLLPDCADEMVWEVGNYGFDLYLSPNIPKLIASLIPAEVEHLLDGKPNPELWAIHPGGRGIVDSIQSLFKLTDEQTRPSRTILRDYGNVSSATLLFVLNEMKQELKSKGSGPANGIALAFGPGLTAELIPITYHPAVISQEQLIGYGRA
ncbi:type III polyketide synthase [Paenibacillus sp. FSL H8-0034]|uniref:type III polyketide synthase n=1 Tax=Paenibacillus sp. FSL H8-0034 TaxID=2954671 RepID=UPI0030FB4B5E